MKTARDAILTKLKWSGITAIGGILMGVGVADCIFAINNEDLNQIARGITILSAGLTIMVIMDNFKTQKAAEKVQQTTQLRLENIEKQLSEMIKSQQNLESQVHEMKEVLSKSKLNDQQDAS